MGECFDAGTDNLHHPATTFAAYRRAWLRWGGHDTFDQLHQWDQFAVGMQKAEVAGAAVTFGQNVLQDQAQALTQAVGTFKLSGGDSSSALASVKRSNRSSTVAKLPNRRPATRKVAASSEASAAPAQPRKVAAGGGGDDWEEF